MKNLNLVVPKTSAIYSGKRTCIVFFSIFVMLAGIAPSVSGQFITIGNFNDPTCLAVIDLDGDGDPDVLTASKTNGGVVWFEAPQWTRNVIENNPAIIWSAQAADLDSDDTLDVVTATFDLNSITWYKGPDWTRFYIDQDLEGALYVAPAYINNDDYPDLFATGFKEIVWYEGPSWNKHVIDPNMQGYVISVADMDGDEDPDIAIATWDSNKVIWYESPGWTRHVVDDSLGWVAYVKAVDLDQDGDTDIVATGCAVNDLVWYEAPAWNKHYIDSGLGWAYGLDVADFDKDGILDVAAVGNVEDIVVIYKGPDWTPYKINGLLDGAVAVQAADLDGDDTLDVVAAAEETADRIVWYKNPVTALQEMQSAPPYTFELQQNFPNPFNPKTVIGWQMAVGSEVDVSIYDILGQKVATLVSGYKPAGIYKVEWDGSGFASGIYLYKMQTDKGFAQTRKLILLK